jgi:hypothetical protein
MFKIFTTVLCFCFFCFSSFIIAQTTNKGYPTSWLIKQQLRAAEYHKMPAFDLAKQQKIDAINDASGQHPWQFGYEHQVQLNLSNSGTWNTLPNGDRIWQIEFESENALSLNLLFDDFYMPVGASMYIFNPQSKEIRGAYTAANNNADRMLGTTLLQGQNMILEYYEPYAQKGQGQLSVSMVVHGYRNLGSYDYVKAIKGLNDAGDCNHDVLCPLGIGWENQINSVAMIIVGGSGSCTGALINNTSNDGTPYFLSANHCGTSPGNWVFRFNWDSPVAVCAQNSNSQDPGGPYNEINGATLKANNSGSDFALMELNNTPSGNVYYAGWDRSGNPVTQTTGIHHPRGDVKKICRDDDAPVSLNWNGAASWEVSDWDQGVTEPASSGSPLFDQNQLLIGQLYGGGAACNGTNDNNQDDNYGRFSTSWDGANASSRLKDWLDPSNSNGTFILGFNPNGPGYSLDAGITSIGGIQENFCNIDSFIPEITLRNYGNDTLYTCDVIYNVDGGPNSTYTWNGSLASGSFTLLSLPQVSATAGAHFFNVSTTQPNGSLDSNTVNDARSFAFYITLGGEQIDYELITDCYGSEITWEVRDSASNVLLFSGGPYNDGFGSTADTFPEQFCLAQGCYKFIIYDSYGDGLDGSSISWCGRSGDYQITDALGNSLVEMTAVDGDFGDSSAHYFCLPFIGLHQQNLYQSNTAFTVYPNPANQLLNIDIVLDSRKTVFLSLHSATGQFIESRTLNQAQKYQHSFDISSLSSGMYFVQMRVDDRVFTQKVVKQ